MRRRLLLATSVAIVISGIVADRIYGRAGKLDKPVIAVPASTDGTPDATVAAMNRILLAHEKQFIGGHYVNAHRVLQFAGGTKTINALLDELSKVEGATLYVRFSNSPDDSGVVERLAGAGQDLPKTYDCQIEHNGWLDTSSLSVTVYLGGNVRPEDLSLPAIHGRAAR